MKKFYKFLSIILVFISLCLTGCIDYNNGYYKRYDNNEYTAQEHYEYIMEECEKSYKPLVKFGYLEDYKVYILHNTLNQPQFFLIELIGLLDLDSVELDDTLNVTMYDEIAEYKDRYTEEQIQELKDNQITSEEAIALGAKRINSQIFGFIDNSGYKLNDRNVGKEYKIKTLKYITHFEIIYPNGWETITEWKLVYRYVNYYNNQNLKDEDLITFSEYKDKKLYYMPLNKKYMIGYEEDDEIVSISNNDGGHYDEIKLGLNNYLTINFKVSDYYKKKIPKEFYPYLLLHGHEWHIGMEEISSGDYIYWERAKKK